MQFASRVAVQAGRRTSAMKGIHGFMSAGSQETILRAGTCGFVSSAARPSNGLTDIERITTQSSAKSRAEIPTLPMQNHNGSEVVMESFAPKTPKKAEASDKWKHITVDMWRDAVYTNQAYFGDLIKDTEEFIRTIAEHIKLSGKRVSLVEVGCGTGEFVRASTDDFRSVVGVDFNKEFVEFCKENVEPRNAGKSHYLQGDACHLNDLLKSEFEGEFWDDARVVACVGNTIGIIPEELRPKVYQQMAEVAGKDGVLVMVYWNANWFGDACLNFYHKNPKLCGPFEGKHVDLKNTSLATPQNYKTKWTSVDEARHIIEEMGMEIISLREKGKGVFVAARRV